MLTYKWSEAVNDTNKMQSQPLSLLQSGAVFILAALIGPNQFGPRAGVNLIGQK